MFDNILNALSGEDFEEKPVEIEEFVVSEDFLGLPPLSEYQYQMIKAGSQIYKKSTLIHLYGEERGAERYQQTCNEVILQLGKGNLADCQKVYSVDRGFLSARDLSYGPWDADTRRAPQPATPFYDEGEDDIFRIITKHGYYFDCGPNHKTPVWKNTKHMKNYTMKKEQIDLPTTHLSKGDILELKVGWAEPRPENQYDVTSDEARLIGYMIGDGSWSRWQGKDAKKLRNPMFTNATKEVQDDFVRIVHSLGGSVTPTVSGMGCWQVRVCGINDWFRRRGLTQYYNTQKGWNDQWLSMSNSNMLELIKGVFATDGWISFTEAGKTIGTGTTKLRQVMAGIEMTSESCIKGLHLSLLKVGIVSKFSAHRPERNGGKHNATYRVCITDTTRVQDLVKMLKDIPGKNENVQQVLNMEVKTRKINDYGDRIEKIVYLGRHKSMGTMVELEHNFNAGGIITCNSGKDYTSTIVCAYIVYLLLCLKDPAKYYGKPSGDTIDILNIAVNSDQARNVFFANFKKRIEGCSWFNGKYDATQNGIMFDKSIRVFSGHSEREAFEGLNLFVAVLDEISAFALESSSGNTQAKTADAVYKMYRASVDSRFPDYGKVLLLSFPRFKDDYIQQRYDAVVQEKEVITKRKTMLLDPDLPEDYPGNAFEIEWEEDHILRYKYPRMFALRRPTWEVNPTVTLDSPAMVRAAREDLGDFLGRFACMPSNLTGGFFKNKEAITAAFVTMNPIDEDGMFLDSFQPKEDQKYFLHVDLAQKHDHCVVSMAHVEKWVEVKIGGEYSEIHPVVVIDAVRWWTPTKEKTVDFADVRDYIVSLKRKGFDITLCTFDRWNSHDTMNILTNEHGIKTDILSVDKKHYDDYLSIMYDHRLIGPKIDLLVDELTEIRTVQRGQKIAIDHPRKGTKDFSDATCGSIFNAITHTRRPQSQEVEVLSYADLVRKNRVEAEKKLSGVIRPPQRSVSDAPNEIQNFISRMRML